LPEAAMFIVCTTVDSKVVILFLDGIIPH
jgi:hypothetical protein